MEDNKELIQMRSDAEKTVTGFVAAATASCAVPIPVADAVVLIGEQISMMAAVSAVYKLGFSKKTLQALVWGALGVSGATAVGKTIVSSILKTIPGMGTVAGSVISASTAATLTFVLGNAFVDLCEAVKKGELTESDLITEKGKTFFRERILVSKKEKGIDAMSFERPEGQGYGVIKKACEIVKDGERGRLIWDYMLVNEITFFNEKTKKSESLFKSISDKKTEQEFERLVSLYASQSDDKSIISTVEIILKGLKPLDEMKLRTEYVMNIYMEDMVGSVSIIPLEGRKVRVKEIMIFDAYQGKGICSRVVDILSNAYIIELSPEFKEDRKKYD